MSDNLIPGQAQGDELAGRSSAGDGGSSSASGDPWMKMAKDAFSRSTTYQENNYRKGWEDGLRMFNSQHPRDSKYNSDAYKYRSRIFRPKTRAVVRKHEATAAMAFFSNPDVVSIDPVNTEDDNQIVSAQVNKELLQYRLTKSIPWFLTVLGAFQDSMTVGICASFQYWEYDKIKKVDKPCCELLPIQNIRFDPAAKWYDVVNTSPYLILQMPMYLRDVLDRMERGYGSEDEKWKTLDKKVILQARVTDHDPVQQARDGRREDPNTVTSQVNEFDVVMIHLNFMKTEDGIFAYYTLKDQHLLTDPKPLEEMFLHGEIPVTVGFCVLETHQSMPSGLIRLGQQLQQEANEIANQRLDNVKFVLNKRWFVRRGSNVDVEGMLRNVPGGVSMVNDVEKDVKEVNWTDVTASSFQEQDRLNADFDDLEGGGLSSSSVMTNRRLNETVGGMKMMSQGSNSLTEYTIRLFVETWVEPTLRQLVKLEQYYESDEVVLAIAAQRAGVWQRFQMSPNLDSLLKQDLTLSINVGMGATDPEARFQRFMQATGAYSKIAQEGAPDLNLFEVRKELYGLAGFKDSKRFFSQADPRWVQAQKMLAQAEQTAHQVVDQAKDRILRRELQLQQREHDLDLRQLELDQKENSGDTKMQEALMDFMLKDKEQQHDFELKEREFQHDVQIQQAEHQLDRQKAHQDMALDRERSAMEMQQQRVEGFQNLQLQREQGHQQMQMDREQHGHQMQLQREKDSAQIKRDDKMAKHKAKAIDTKAVAKPEKKDG